jgi:hypothetical protein
MELRKWYVEISIDIQLLLVLGSIGNIELWSRSLGIRFGGALA